MIGIQEAIEASMRLWALCLVGIGMLLALLLGAAGFGIYWLIQHVRLT